MFPKIHKAITQRAFQGKFSPKALESAMNGNTATDLSFRFLIPEAHCMDITVQRSRDYIKKLQQKTEKAFIEATNFGSSEKRNSFITRGTRLFGESLHTIQDFFSHTNIVDILSVRGKKGSELLKENPFALYETKGLKTCRDNSPKDLKHEIKRFILGNNRDYEHYLIPDLPGKRLSHATMNLDGPGTEHDIVFKLKHGISGYKVACALAEEGSKSLWKETEQHLIEKLGSQNTFRLLETLRNWGSKEQPRRKIQVFIPEHSTF